MAGKHLLLKEKAKKKKKGSNHEKNVTKKPIKRKVEEDCSRNKKKKKKIVNGNDAVIVPDSASECENEVEVQGNGEEEEEVESFKIENLLSRKGKDKGDAKKKKSKPKDEGNVKKKSKPNDEGKVKMNGKVKESTHMYSFPMDRISRMIKADDPEIRISQEAVFIINKASEKFLELFTKEGYTNVVLDKKKQVDYRHLSSVVTKKRKFDFLSDFVPETVKAEDALAEASTANP